MIAANNNVLLLALTLLLHIGLSAASQLYLRRSFSWRASLDSSTGIASSLERSVFSPKEDLIVPTQREAVTFVQNEFCKYPQFLQKVSLTLGLCRVLPTSEHSCNLHTSIFPINLLSFGKPISKKKNNAICCVQIPIVGGLLANINPKLTNHGFLSFTWYHEKDNITLVTEIVENYQPALAGSKIPVPCWRNKLYSSTQRLFHEYVMWRYHGFVLKEFEKQCLKKI